jgi:hypothetical protein
MSGQFCWIQIYEATSHRSFSSTLPGEFLSPTLYGSGILTNTARTFEGGLIYTGIHTLKLPDSQVPSSPARHSMTPR